MRLPVLTLSCVGAALAAAAWPPLAGWLVYDREALLHGELWRLGSAVFVHFSPSHLLWDVLVFAGAGSAVELGRSRGLLPLFLLSAFAPALWLLIFAPEVARYGGLSAPATAAVTYLGLCGIREERGVVASLWSLLLALVAAKIAFEFLTGAPLFAVTARVPFRAVPSAHALGCAAALLVKGWNCRQLPVSCSRSARIPATSRSPR